MSATPNYTPFKVLLTVDLVLIALHAIHVGSPLLSDPSYAITVDRGLGEHFQYLKALWVALAFLGLSRLRLDRAYLVWAAAFAYLMLDDALLIHERAGLKLGRLLELPSVLGLRPDDLGELLTALVLGGVLLTVLAGVYLRGTTEFRRVSRVLVGMLALLAGFGIVADMGSVLAYGTVLEHPVSMIEDGGEMVVLSGVASYAWRLLATELRRPGRAGTVAAVAADPVDDDEAGARDIGARSRDGGLAE